MQEVPTNRSVLCLNLILRNPFIIPITIAAADEIVTIMLAVPIAAFCDDPKNVEAMSIKNKLARTSSIPVAKKASIKEAMRRFCPIESVEEPMFYCKGPLAYSVC